jgi:DNA ligase (NAD+)
MSEGPRHPVVFPDVCPVCDEPLLQEGNSGQLKCPSLYCSAQVANRLVHWCGGDAADIDGLGSSIIEKLVEANKVSQPSDFYYLDVDDFVDIGRSHEFGVKMCDLIDASRHIGMRRAIIGLAIPHVSTGTAKRLCQHYESVEMAFCVDDGELLAIKDIGPTVANSISEWYIEGGMDQLDQLFIAGVKLDRLPADEPKDPRDDSVSLAKTFVLTGSIEGHKNRKDFAEILESYGWESQSGVSKKTDFLITDDTKLSSKMKKASDLGVPRISSAYALELAKA